MKPQDHKFKEAHRKEIRMDKDKHYDSMTLGGKRPSERAREAFRRPPYAGLYSSGGENLNGVKTCSGERRADNGREKA